MRTIALMFILMSLLTLPGAHIAFAEEDVFDTVGITQGCDILRSHVLNEDEMLKDTEVRLCGCRCRRHESGVVLTLWGCQIAGVTVSETLLLGAAMMTVFVIGKRQQ